MKSLLTDYYLLNLSGLSGFEKQLRVTRLLADYS